MNYYVLVFMVLVIAYLIGSINFSIVFGKSIKGVDVREAGSRSAGATNTLRLLGKRMGALVLLCDLLKGVLAVLIARFFLEGNVYVMCLAGLFAMIGHIWPVYFKFKGGKGVATCAGVLFALNWKYTLILAVILFLVVAVTRYVSLGSICAAIATPIVFGIGTKDIWIICFGVAIALLVLYKHKQNIKRLLTGTENKLGGNKGLPG